MAQKKVDVLIIGSGHTGGMAAKILTEKGIECTMLDAGPMLNFEKDRELKPANELPYRGFDAPGRLPHVFQSSEFNANIWLDEKVAPYSHPADQPYNWVRVRSVGGRSPFWGRQSFRHSDYEFKSKDHDGFGENWPISLKDLVPYYGAKWQQEQDLKASGIAHVIFRPSFVFARDGGILPTFVKLAKLTPATPIIGSGKQRIQPIWADDVAAYFAEATSRPDVTGRLFELGGPDAVTWNEFWERLKRVRGLRRPSLHVPVALMRVNALVTERLPGNIPLTRDLLKMLELGDNVVSSNDAVRTFQLPLVPLDEQLRRAA